jgi:hypothetical protein
MTYHSPRYYADLSRFPSRRHRSFHHFSYRHLKRHGSLYWIHGVYLPQWFHVPVLHRLLGWGDRAGTQRLGKFPNIFQRAMHWGLRAIALLTMPFDGLVPLYARAGAVVFWGVGARFVVLYFEGN